MAVAYKIDFTSEILALKLDPDLLLDPDEFLSAFENNSRDINFTPEFCEHLASELGVENVQGTKMKSFGTQNTHYELEDNNGNKYVLRMGGDGSLLSDEHTRIIDEFFKLKALEGICPDSFKVHFLDKTRKFTPFAYFVGEFIKGIQVALAIMGEKFTDDQIAQTARMLKSIHSTDVKEVEENNFPDVEAVLYTPYLSVIPETCDKGEEFMSKELRKKLLEAVEDVKPLVGKSPFGFVHGDFHVGNLLLTESGIRAVDWEMAHVGYQIIDVATFAMQGLSKEQSEFFYREYGYGQTLEEKLVNWFFILKRTVIGLWFMSKMTEGQEKMISLIVKHMDEQIDNKPTA